MLEDVGLGFNTMSNMKSSMPKADNLAKIADYLEVSVDYLLGRTDDPGQKTEPAPQLIRAERHKDPDIEMFLRLDDVDRAELRGEMKQMLKAEKYQVVEVYTAARSADHHAPEMREVPKSLLDKMANRSGIANDDDL